MSYVSISNINKEQNKAEIIARKSIEEHPMWKQNKNILPTANITVSVDDAFWNMIEGSSSSGYQHFWWSHVFSHIIFRDAYDYAVFGYLPKEHDSFKFLCNLFEQYKKILIDRKEDCHLEDDELFSLKINKHLRIRAPFIENYITKSYILRDMFDKYPEIFYMCSSCERTSVFSNVHVPYSYHTVCGKCSKCLDMIINFRPIEIPNLEDRFSEDEHDIKKCMVKPKIRKAVKVS